MCWRALVPVLHTLLLLSAAVGGSSAGCDRSRWESRLDIDLSGFEASGVTREDVKEAARNLCGGYVVTITNGQLYATPVGWEAQAHAARDPAVLVYPHSFLTMFARMLCTYNQSTPAVTFALNTYDRLCVEKRASRPSPVFSWGKDTIGDDHQILVPYLTFLHLREHVDNMGTGPPWSKRKEVAIWRGTTTGGSFNRWNWHQYPRSRLVRACASSALCDAKFTGYPQATDDARAAINASGGHGDPLPMSEFLRYKYIVVNDGNMAPSSRLFMLLRSGSLILKQESPAIEFYYDDLKPYKHYVPLSFSHEDVEHKVRWAQRHDRAARAIAANADAYAKRILTEYNVYCYMHRLLVRYARAQQFTPYFNSSWQLVPSDCPTHPPEPSPAPTRLSLLGPHNSFGFFRGRSS